MAKKLGIAHRIYPALMRITDREPSFLSEAKRFDLLILRSAWSSVELADESVNSTPVLIYYFLWIS